MVETRLVKLALPLKIGDVQHYAGEEVVLDLETAKWYAQAVVDQRQQDYDKMIVVDSKE